MDSVGHNRFRPYYHQEEIDRVQSIKEGGSGQIFLESDESGRLNQKTLTGGERSTAYIR